MLPALVAFLLLRRLEEMDEDIGPESSAAIARKPERPRRRSSGVARVEFRSIALRGNEGEREGF